MDDQYAELTEKCVEALRANRDTVEITVDDLLILLAKAQMARYPVPVPYPAPWQPYPVPYPYDTKTITSSANEKRTLWYDSSSPNVSQF